MSQRHDEGPGGLSELLQRRFLDIAGIHNHDHRISNRLNRRADMPVVRAADLLLCMALVDERTFHYEST